MTSRSDIRRVGLVLAAVAAVVLGAAAPAPLAPAAAQTKPAEDPVVATVNGEKIHLSDMLAVYRSLPQRLQEIPFERLYRPILEQLIAVRLLAAEGRKQKLQETAEVKRRLAQVEDQLVQQAYIDKVVAQKTTEAALKARYEAFVKDYKGEEEIRAAHILVKTREEAMAIIAKLDKGEDFDKVAKEPQPPKVQAGDLGWFEKGQMVKEFAEAAFALKKGEHSKAPVQTQFGWHVIKLTDRRTKPAPKFEEVQAQLKEELSQQLAQEEVARLRSAAKIERFGPDGAPLKDEEPPKK
jgi:peptidyl-prolyl cis-trans isomerase C